MKTKQPISSRAAAWVILTLVTLPSFLCQATTIPEQSMGFVTPLGDYGYGASVGVSGEYAIVGNRLQCQDTGKDFRTVDILVRNAVDNRWDKWKSLLPVSGRYRYFGWSVAIDGDTAVVGAPDYLNVGAEGADLGSGAFFVYGRNQGGANQWGLVKTFNPPGASFGYRVRLSGDTLVVGEPRFQEEGRIYIYSRNQGGANNWGQVKMLLPPVALPGLVKEYSRFGTVFDVSAGRLAVGGYNEDWESPDHGVNIYQVNTGGVGSWGLERTINPGSAAENGFGHRVALEGNRLAVSFVSGQGRQIRLYSGASYNTLTTLSWPGMADFGPADIGGDILAVRMRLSSGHVYATTYRWPDAGGFSLLQTRFVGYGATALSEGIAATSDSVLLGVDDPVSQANASGAGCVRALDRTTGGADGWGLWAAVKPEMPGGGGFGKSMAMNGDWLVVGNPDFPAGGTARGMVSVFVRYRDRWSLESRLTPMSGPGFPAPGPQDNARFGESVAVDSLGNVLVGAPGENGNDGAAYRFERVTGSSSYQQEGVSYVQTERLSSGLAGTGMKFGSSVAMDTWVMFTGAPEGGAGGAGNVYEWRRTVGGGWGFGLLPRTDADGNTANDAFGTALAMDGLNLVVTAMGDESNGSAFYYEYNTTTGGWVQRQEIIPTDTTTGLFGKSVAFKDTRLVVGVYPFALFLIGPGNAFLFNRSGSTWTQQAFLRTPGLENGDAHGFSSALGKDFAIVGVPGDDGVSNGTSNAGGAWLYNTFGGTTNSAFLHEIRSGVAGEEAGASVAADWFHLAVSAPKSDVVGADSGLVRLYRLGSYERWACSKLLNPGSNGPWHDEDGDGDTNLVEFAFNTNPKSGASRGQLSFSLNTVTPGAPRHFRAYYVKPVSYSTEGLQTQYQSGNSPANMGYGGMTITVDTSALLIGHLTQNVVQAPRAFVRLRVDYPVR